MSVETFYDDLAAGFRTRLAAIADLPPIAFEGRSFKPTGEAFVQEGGLAMDGVRPAGVAGEGQVQVADRGAYEIIVKQPQRGGVYTASLLRRQAGLIMSVFSVGTAIPAGALGVRIEGQTPTGPLILGTYAQINIELRWRTTRPAR